MKNQGISPRISVGQHLAAAAATPANAVRVSAAVPTWQQTIQMQGPPEAGNLLIGFQCQNMPTDGFVAMTVPGPDAANSVNIAKTQITYPNMAMFVTVTWPANFSTEGAITYWAGPTTPPAGASITAQMLLPVSPGQTMVVGSQTFQFS